MLTSLLQGLTRLNYCMNTTSLLVASYHSTCEQRQRLSKATCIVAVAELDELQYIIFPPELTVRLDLSSSVLTGLRYD